MLFFRKDLLMQDECVLLTSAKSWQVGDEKRLWRSEKPARGI